MEEQYTASQRQTIRDYLEGMLVAVRENYERQTRLIEGKLKWLNSIEQPDLFVVDSAGIVTIQRVPVGTVVEGGLS